MGRSVSWVTTSNPPVAMDAEAVEEARGGLPDPHILDLVLEAFGALSDKTRAKILYALVRRSLCVRDLALTVGASESAVSHHLRLLRDRRLVRPVRREGNQIEYRLDDNHVAALFCEAEYHADHVRAGLPDLSRYTLLSHLVRLPVPASTRLAGGKAPTTAVETCRFA